MKTWDANVVSTDLDVWFDWPVEPRRFAIPRWQIDAAAGQKLTAPEARDYVTERLGVIGAALERQKRHGRATPLVDQIDLPSVLK